MIKSNLNIKRLSVIGAFFILPFLTGCAALTPALPIESIDISEYDSLTSLGAINTLQKRLEKSKNEKLNLFAPTHYSLANKALIDARDLITKKASREQIVQKVAVAEAMLRNGKVVMEKVKGLLQEQFLVKKKLDQLDTKNAYENEYGGLIERLNNTIRKIETSSLEQNKNDRTNLLQDMQKLELRAIRYSALNEPSEILKRIKYRNGEKLAPMTYHDALAIFQQAEEFIDAHPENKKGIEALGKEVLFAAKRALYITDQVAALIQKVNFSLEQVVLDEEYRLYRISRELKSADLRDSPLEKQSEQLATLARNRSEEYQGKEDLITALRDTLIEVRDSSRQLAALAESEAKLKQTQNTLNSQDVFFKTQVSALTNKLNTSQTLLDKTQQKLLAMKDANNHLLASHPVFEKTIDENFVINASPESEKFSMTKKAADTLKSLMALIPLKDTPKQKITSEEQNTDEIFVDAGNE